MGLILNPRGAGGSGKTELVRRILNRYGWSRGAYLNTNAAVRPVFKAGRSRPFAYRLQHPFGGRPLVVLGHYEVTSGGCDTIRLEDGGLAQAFRSASAFAAAGHDVVFEGLRLSSDIEHSVALAELHDVHILQLSTPLDKCVGNLMTRRRARRSVLPSIAQKAVTEQKRIRQACEGLTGHARVEALPFDAALARAEQLLGLTNP